MNSPTCTTATSSAKGTRNGICNRTACDNSHAVHYNRVTERWYCTPCARLINENAAQLQMEPLCSWPTREQMGNDHLLLPIIPDAKVRTHLGETGTVVGRCITNERAWNVQIDGALDKQTPPRWEGELVEAYRDGELTVLKSTPCSRNANASAS